MNPSTDPTIQPWSAGFFTATTQLYDYLPRLIAAIVVWIVGVFVAKTVRRVVVQALSALRVSSALEKTPLGVFLKNAEVGEKVEEILGSVAYWLLLLVFAQAVVSMLGLTTIDAVFTRLFDYLPHIFVAVVIFLFGVVMAGVVESVVKGLFPVASQTGRFFAKVASYMVITVSLLAGVAELGIASDFIRMLFAGVVFAFALGLGLAFGLGGQETVKNMLAQWYEKPGVSKMKKKQ